MPHAAQPVILGVPFDANSSFLRGPAQAPPRIREALHSDATNSWTEGFLDLSSPGVLRDAGDISFSSDQNAFPEIEKRVAGLLAEGLRPVSLGGDHSITWPIMKAFAAKYRDLTIVHFDAHPDLYDEFEGSRESHACPFARIMEEGLSQRLIQVGIRTMNRHQREQADRFGVEVFTMSDLPVTEKLSAITGQVYLSFDMDVLDPAFAPGISHREPGGMSVREALSHLHAIRAQIVGADLVEYNPVQDLGGVTAIVAAKILKEILGTIIKNA